MSESPRYVTCNCQHCSGGIEFDANNFAEEVSLIPCPHCGVETKLFVPTPALHSRQQRGKPRNTKLAELTEETIRSSTKSGDTPLHQAAKKGTIREIPKHLLQKELFLVLNGAGKTPLHIAAEYGSLDQVPKEFLTEEAVTIRTEPPYAPGGVHTTGSGYRARTETVLHIAVRCGHADQIPKEFFTPEFLSLEASGYRLTLLHDLAYANRLDLVPEVYSNSEIWGLKDYVGRTPRDVLEEKTRREEYVAAVRSEPATEKQKEKLRFFGYALREGMTKGEASDAIDECVTRFPERDAEYYGRPATEQQLAQLLEYAKADEDLVIALKEWEEEGSVLTYGEAKDLLLECKRDAEQREMDKFTNPPDEAQRMLLTELGFKLDTKLDQVITAAEVDDILSLRKATPREEDLELFRQHGISSFEGDGLAAFALGDLIRSFGGSAQSHNRRNVNYAAACQAAVADPAFQTPKLTRDWEGFLAFAWPKGKIREWLRGQ